MNDSLSQQAKMAPRFVSTSWPRVRAQTSERLDQLDMPEIEYIVLCGCGDSHHAALGLDFAMSLWTGRRVRATTSLAAARYVLPVMHTLAERVLVVGFSASGEVARTIEAIEVGNALAMHTLAVTGAADSKLAEIARSKLVLPSPAVPHGPGLLSYLASLLMGFSIAYEFSNPRDRAALEHGLAQTPEKLESLMEREWSKGDAFAQQGIDAPVVFLGAGPAYGSALFGAAKVIEASGGAAWGQDLEEWAHLEYFCEPASMNTWLLRGAGRSASREEEVEQAARRLGRHLVVSDWDHLPDSSPAMREALAPLGLWLGPVSYASQRAHILGEQPYRGFGGGRSREEGGGASRIRSSQRIDTRTVRDQWRALI